MNIYVIILACVWICVNGLALAAAIDATPWFLLFLPVTVPAGIICIMELWEPKKTCK